MLEICLPGTGGMLPLPTRWLACCWMEYQGKALLIDCGEGAQIALRVAGCRLSRLELLLLTHFHADHLAGLPGLLLSLGNTGRTAPLLIAGPPGLREVLPALLVIAPLPYRLLLCELAPGDALDGWAGLRVSCRALSHWVPCYGYRVEVARKPVFNPEKAKALGVPPPLWKELHSGGTVALADGRRVAPQEVLDGERPPLVVSYSTDTRPVDAVAALAENAGLMIAEGLYAEDALAEKAHGKGHMVFAEAAGLAARAGAERLWLTHFSPALTDPEAGIGFARAQFPAARAGRDGMRITLGGGGAGRDAETEGGKTDGA